MNETDPERVPPMQTTDDLGEKRGECTGYDLTSDLENERDRDAGPWRRFSARVYDMWFFGWAVGFIIIISGGDRWLAGLQRMESGIILLPCILLAETIIYALSGMTLGKWIFSISVRGTDNLAIRPGLYLKRNIRLYASGLCFGLPLFSLVTMIFQASRVSKGLKTTYDDAVGAHVVRYRSRGILRLIAGAVFLFIAYAGFSSAAQALLVSRSANGIVEHFYSDAISIQELATAAQSSPHAKNALGLRYLSGKGVSVDLPKAEKLFQAAGEQGLAVAWYNLAVCLSNDPNRDSEFKFTLLRAASAGIPDAQCDLGLLISSDPQRLPEALDWIRKASAGGCNRAKSILDEYEQQRATTDQSNPEKEP